MSTQTSNPILTWDDAQEQSGAAQIPSSVAMTGLPQDAQQLAGMVNLANTILQNPTLGVVGRYMADPAILVNGMPNMAKMLELKSELDSLAKPNHPHVGRFTCHHCQRMNSIDWE